MTSLLAMLAIQLQSELPWPRVESRNSQLQNLVKEIRADKWGKIHSLIVIKDGNLVCEEYFNGTNAESPQDLQSATKSIASFVTGIAIDQKRFKLNDPVAGLLPSHYTKTTVPQNPTLTVRDVLIMKHGMQWHEWGAKPAEKDNYIMANSKDWIKYLLDQPTVCLPDQMFNYSTGASVYLSGIIHGRTGMSTEAFSKKFLFDPIGVTSQSWWVKDKFGIEHTGGGLKMKPMDLARIGYLMLEKGNWFGKQIVSSSYMNEAFVPDTKDALAIKLDYGTQRASYGYHCWLLPIESGGKTFNVRAAMGVGGQYIFAVRELKLLVVTTAWNVTEPAQSRPIGWMKNVFLPQN